VNVDQPVLLDTYLDVLPARVSCRIVVAGSCHVWTGASSGRTLGGGTTRVDGRTEFVHRLVWASVHGPIPPWGIVVRVCRQRRCVRPDHLRLTTTSAWLMAIRHGADLAA